MGNFHDFLAIDFFFNIKSPEKIQGSENTLGKFQSIWMLTSSWNEDLKSIYNVKFLNKPL